MANSHLAPARSALIPGTLSASLISATLVLAALAASSTQAVGIVPDLPPPQSAAQSSTVPSEMLAPEEAADLHMAHKRFQAAIEVYSQIQPKTPNIWNKLGIAYQQMYLMADARRSYEAALRMDPKSADVLNNLGSLCYSQKLYSDAERNYRKALKINTTSGIIYKNLGTTLLAENKLKKGWESYQTALMLDPGIFEHTGQYSVGGPTPAQKRGAMNYFLAKSYLRAGNADRAVGYLRMAIDEGYTDRKKVMADKEFASLRGTSSFDQLLSEQRSQ